MELVLVLPAVVLLVLAVVQVVVVANGSLAAVHATREATRAASLGRAQAEVVAAAVRGGGLPPGRVSVAVAPGAETVRVTVTYRQETDVPLVGLLVGDVVHTESLVMWREVIGG